MNDDKIKEIAEKIVAEQKEMARTGELSEEAVRKYVAEAQAAQKAVATSPEPAISAEDIASIVEAEVRKATAADKRSLDLNERDSSVTATSQRKIASLIQTPTSDAKVVEFQKAHGDVHLARKLDSHLRSKAGKRIRGLEELEQRFLDTADSIGIDTRATTFSTSGAATGAEFMFDIPSSELISRIDQLGDIARIFPEVRVPRGGKSITLPREGAEPTVYTVAQSTDDTGASATLSNPATSQVTFSTGKHSAYTMASIESLEDSIVETLPWISDQLARAHATALEHAIISGDTTSALDSTMAAGDQDAIFDGLREKTITDFTSATKDIAALADPSDTAELRKLMGKYGVDPTNLAYIVPFNLYYNWMKNAEFTSIDKVGPLATLLTGTVGMVAGSPVLVSQEFPQNLNAAGVIDGVTTTKHAYLCVNRAGWRLVRQRDLIVRVDDVSRIEFDQVKLVASRRVGFKSVYADSENVASLGYNLAN